MLAGPLFSQLSSLRSFLRELRPLLGSVGTTAALTAVDELQALGQLLVDWGVHREQLLLEPLLTPQAEYFSGTLFQASSNGWGSSDALLRLSPAAAMSQAASGTVLSTSICLRGCFHETTSRCYSSRGGELNRFVSCVLLVVPAGAVAVPLTPRCDPHISCCSRRPL